MTVERDIRQTPLYGELEEHYRKALEPAFGRISGASNPVPSPDGRTIAFTGSRLEKLEGTPDTRLCLVDVAGGAVEEITGGPNNDRFPRWSPDGSRLAFLSDRQEKGKNALYLLRSDRVGEAVSTPAIDGTAEYLEWSPDGSSILLGVAGRGADLAGVQGSGTTGGKDKDLPEWMPVVDTAPTARDFRRAYRHDLETGTTEPLSRDGLNVWEAVWAGPRCLLAVVSEDPSENAWYSAPLALIDVDTRQERIVYRSDWQLGVPAASPSGNRLAVIEALCSDRAVVAGDLLTIDPESGAVTRIDTGGVDVTHLVWRDEDRLFFSGVRNLSAVFGEYNAGSGEMRELWTHRGSAAGFYPQAWPLEGDSFVTVTDSYEQYPEIVLVRDGKSRALTALAHEGTAYLRSIAGRMEEISWTARDGLEIQGLLLTPSGTAPYPLIVSVHGGPVSSVRSRWVGPGTIAFLVSRGYAFLFPNPRGSTGRGQEFARQVYGDLGGSETGDTLSGIDALVKRGIADPKRIGVTGGSHGGFMSSWLITQSDRFAAAVPMHPVTDFYSQHTTSNIGRFDDLFLQEEWDQPGNRHYQRSPVMHAHRVSTPTLNIAGQIDRCTPPGQAQEFHGALLEHGVESALVTYPGEGHGVRKLPAVIDVATRVVDWFQRHMPA